MFSNVIYKLSTFSDYSSISYNQDDTFTFIKSLSDFNLVPSIYQEILPNGSLSRRLHFLGNNGLLIMINSGRIDIQLTSDKKEGFDKEAISSIKEIFIKIYNCIFSLWGEIVSNPNRLAWYTSCVYFEITENQKADYRNRFLKEISFFKEDRLDDIKIGSGQYNKKGEEIKIYKYQDLNEKINIITTINRIEENLDSDAPIDGYRIDYDINTWQNNKRNRFSCENIETFMNISTDLQQKLDEEFLHE